jgi:hypothetical protein
MCLFRELRQTYRQIATIIGSSGHHSLVICLASAFLIPTLPMHAQVNGVGERPYLGWSSFSQQTISSGFLTQANIMAQSDALRASGLQPHGFNYINMDSGWMVPDRLQVPSLWHRLALLKRVLLPNPN